MRQRVAYVMSRFPHLPETFILREMVALEARGWQVLLYPLIFQRQEVVHPEARPWIARAWKTGFLSPKVLGDNLLLLLRSPKRYLGTLGRVLWENRTSPKFLSRAVILWPKSISLAREATFLDVPHIHAHYATHPALVAWIVHRLTGIPYSITVHAHDIFVCHAMLETKLRDAAFVVAISEFNRRYLQELLGAWVASKTHVVHCGLDPARYAGETREWHSDERFEIVHTGSLQPYKGQRYLIDACARLRERGIPFRCRLIGGGALEAALRERIHSLGLEEQVFLLGAKTQDEVAALLAESHCYVQPSVVTPSGKMEGIPVALMEALASGLPVVATEISGIPELVRPGETGWLVPEKDAGALADALEMVYRHPAEAARRAEAGRDLVWREFTLQKNVEDLITLFATSPGISGTTDGTQEPDRKFAPALSLPKRD